MINKKQELAKFLVKAKINTYASSGEGGEKILPDGRKEFSFEESVYVSNTLEKVFSTPEGWVASEAYHYRQDQEDLKQNLIDGRYSGS